MILTKTPCSCNEERAHTNTLHINRGKVSLIQLDPPDQIQLHRAAQMSRISMRQIRINLEHREIESIRGIKKYKKQEKKWITQGKNTERHIGMLLPCKFLW